MNKNIKMILAAAAIALGTGCVHAGTWVNGYYIDGPLCTVCDGMRVVQHAYGTTVCTHCNGTGIEPPEETIVNTVVVDTWCPPPPPPRWHHRPAPPPRHRPAVHRAPPPRHHAPAARRAPCRPAPAAHRAPAPRGGGRARPGGRR